MNECVNESHFSEIVTFIVGDILEIVTFPFWPERNDVLAFKDMMGGMQIANQK